MKWTLIIVLAAVCGAGTGTVLSQERVARQEAMPHPDRAKRMVEHPIKERMTTLVEAPRPAVLRWHASFDQAVEAASTSRKPVMLFQLLGRYDDEFC